MGSLLDELRAAAGEPRTVTVPHRRSVVVTLYVAADALRANRRALNVDHGAVVQAPRQMLPRTRKGRGLIAPTPTAYASSHHHASSIGRAGQSGAWSSGSPGRQNLAMPLEWSLARSSRHQRYSGSGRLSRPFIGTIAQPRILACSAM